MIKVKIIQHLFRTEFSKITAVLSKHFGIDYIDIAEDITSDTFLTALEIWPHQGVPENPTAWLYTVAKNKARNHFNRKVLFRQKISRQLKYESTEYPELEIDFTDQNISDSMLQMLFTLCHPSIPVKAQIALSLRILCGFGIEEISNALLTRKETINKQLYRARKTLRRENISIAVPSKGEIDKRLATVLTTLYLLFNEGYYSESNDKVLRKDLCLEAMRLTNLLAENESIRTPDIYALLALMCFHASRFDARKSKNGEMVLYQDQDEQLWNKELISKGAYFLKRASQGDKASKYHLEAAIAWWHTQKQDTMEKWEGLLKLYNQLLHIDYSPIAALNRIYALSKVRGKNTAIAEAGKLNLSDSPYYHTLLGELYIETDVQKARLHFQKAISLAGAQGDRQIIQKKIDLL